VSIGPGRVQGARSGPSSATSGMNASTGAEVSSAQELVDTSRAGA